MHFREKRSSSNHQNTDASSPNKKTFEKPLVQPHPQGPSSTIKKNHKLQGYRKDTPKHRNLNKMKRQRNIQQVKEQDKCTPNQTKEEEIWSLPEKEFKIMIVKMIQNLENKMELDK